MGSLGSPESDSSNSFSSSQISAKESHPRLLEESSSFYNSCGLHNWQQHFQCKNRLGTEKENARNKQRLQKAHSLDPRSHIHPQLDQNIIWSNSQSSEFKNNGQNPGTWFYKWRHNTAAKT